MILEKQGKTTRIVLSKFYLPALNSVFKLQRKTWFGWKTSAWIYPSCIIKFTFEEVKEWLFWSEKRNFNEYRKGKQIFNKLNKRNERNIQDH